MPAPIFTAQIYYKTRSGADLLDPQSSGYFNRDGIKVFDVFINSSGVEMNTPSSFNTYGSSACAGYVCEPYNKGLYSIQFVVRPQNELRKELIQLNSSITDTLVYQIISATPQVGYAVNKIFYKDQLVWSRGMPAPAAITIVK